MMDKTYILENGLLEQYVLGELSMAESEQLEAILKQDSDLKSLKETIEKQLEHLAFENKIEPPSSIKSNLMSAVSGKAVKVASIARHNSNSRYVKVMAGVAAVLVVGLCYMLVQFNDLNNELKLAEEDNNTLKNTINNLSKDLNDTKAWYAIINDPDVKKYVLTGNTLLPEAKVISYINDTNKSVVLNTEGLPALDDAHDYQMWADVEGEMINMGLIDKNQDMIVMNYIDDAESLNITIEPAGGSDHPNVSKLVSNIYLD